MMMENSFLISQTRFRWLKAEIKRVDSQKWHFSLHDDRHWKYNKKRKWKTCSKYFKRMLLLSRKPGRHSENEMFKPLLRLALLHHAPPNLSRWIHRLENELSINSWWNRPVYTTKKITKKQKKNDTYTHYALTNCWRQQPVAAACQPLSVMKLWKTKRFFFLILKKKMPCVCFFF